MNVYTAIKLHFHDKNEFVIIRANDDVWREV